MPEEVIPVAPEADSFDEDILAEIERRLDLEETGSPSEHDAVQKVELDKADLPLDYDLEIDEEPEPEPAPEVEVDLAEEEPPPPEPDETLLAEDKSGKKTLLWAALGAGGLVAVATVLSILIFGGEPEKPKPKVEAPKPWFFRAQIPDYRLALRLNLKPFIVPLGKSKDGLILRVVVSLETLDPESKDLIAEKSRMIRDTIYRLLRGRLASEMKSTQNKLLLQAQIKAELNHNLNKLLVHKVYFTDFVITG